MRIIEDSASDVGVETLFIGSQTLWVGCFRGTGIGAATDLSWSTEDLRVFFGPIGI